MRALTLICGDAEFLVDEEFRRVREQLTAAGASVEEIDPADDLAVAAALDTASLFGGGRVVVLRATSTAIEPLADKLGRFADDPMPETHVVVVTGAAKRLTKTLGARADVIEVSAPKPWETAQWLVRYAKGHGRVIKLEAAELLVETLGTDLRELAGAFQTLAIGDGAIDQRAITNHFRGQGTAIYTFLDAILSRDRAAALSHLHALMRSGDHPLVLHAALAKQVRALAAMHGLRREEQPSAKDLDLAQGYLNRAGKAARSWNADDIRRALVALAEADLALKGGFEGEDAPPELIAELLVVELTTGAPEPAR